MTAPLSPTTALRARLLGQADANDLLIAGCVLAFHAVNAKCPMCNCRQEHSVLLREAAAALEAAPIGTLCTCEQPDPVMQADGRFYCHRCSLLRPSQICERCRVEVMDAKSGGEAADPASAAPQLIRPMTMAAVEATRARAETDKAANAERGTFACYRCADTGIVPAPEPYGSWGCHWHCPEPGCVAGEEARARGDAPGSGAGEARPTSGI